MPFTFSHPAAVLPLSIIPKKYISVSALIIGSITPDFELFIRFNQVRTISHTWMGMFSFDLPLGLFLLLIFNLLIRDALIDNLPLFLNKRFSRFKTVAGKKNIQKDVVIILISLLVGIASHLVWDRFTHKTGDILEEAWGNMNRFFWDASSVVGAIIIALTVLGLPKGVKTKKNNIVPFWLLLFVIAFTDVFLYLPYAKSYVNVGISFISGSLIGLIVSSTVETIKSKWMLRTAKNP